MEEIVPEWPLKITREERKLSDVSARGTDLGLG